ncbi:MAG TPA: glycoside hydrolase family 3 N-terminal domain-containing protein [Steroidobacteraceae bacterium]|nr:glycoside hydrolase family 3 N-terminal domain-containing protein [Steroidobacteraceae bacterium]
MGSRALSPIRHGAAVVGIVIAALLHRDGAIAESAAPARPASGASVHADLWPEIPHSLKNPETERFVDQLLGELTLEEKIGQMIQADIASLSPEDLRRYRLGSVLAGGGSAPGDDVRSTPQAWLDLTDVYYRAALSASHLHAPPIPIVFGIDAVHGNAKLIGATIFPHNVGLGAAHDAELIMRIGRATAEEVAAAGIDWTFAPTVAVARDVRWGRSYESYSESPELVAQYAAAMVTGLQGARDSPEFMAPGHTLASVKHFLGDGGTRGGRDQGVTAISEADLASIHAAGYAAAIKAGAMIVMASYNSWNGVKMHANHYLLTDILKGRLGFDGFVVGDWNAHEQIPGCTKYRCPAAIVAGVDMLMAPDSWRELYKNTLAEVRSGEIPRSRIDDAVRRILRVKALAGVFTRPPPKDRPDAAGLARLGSPAHRAIAREAVRKSLVLLKNDGAVLPLDPHSRILVAGEGADSIAMQCGGWTVDWQGDHNTNGDFPGGTSIYEGIRAAAAAAGGSAVLSRDGRFAEKPDAAIVVFGEHPYAEFQGDRENLQFADDAHELELLRRLRAEGVATVAVFLSGRPLWVNPYINAADAFVAAWLPGSEGEGVADVLVQPRGAPPHHDFTGRLAFSWPMTAMPVVLEPAGQATGAAFARGFGLDYRSATRAAALPEDPRIPAEWAAPRGSLFQHGHPTAPWSLFVADEGAEVHVTTSLQASPHRAVEISLGSEGARATWAGSEEGLVTLSGRARDLSSSAGDHEALSVRYRVEERPGAAVMLGMRCVVDACAAAGGAARDVTRVLQAARPNEWRTLTVPLACYRAAGADLSGVVAPFALSTAGRLRLVVADVALVRASADAKCP